MKYQSPIIPASFHSVGVPYSAVPITHPFCEPSISNRPIHIPPAEYIQAMGHKQQHRRTGRLQSDPLNPGWNSSFNMSGIPSAALPSMTYRTASHSQIAPIAINPTVIPTPLPVPLPVHTIHQTFPDQTQSNYGESALNF